MPIDIIQKYFTGLTDLQQQQFAQLDSLYREWNAKINVISRKDIDNLYEHHILPYSPLAGHCQSNQLPANNPDS